MTVSRNDIQTLIAEIDQLLWVGGQATETEYADSQQRYHAVLEKARWCLGNLIRQVDVPTPPPATLVPAQQDTADAIAQAVISQMNFQRQDWLQPMQLELETLRQQRETLQRDIRHLETHQRQMSHELLQTVMHRCSESMKQELLAVFEQLQGQFGQAIAGAQPHTTQPPAMQQLDWLERLRSLEQQADQLFLSLDQTFHQVFDSLEQDVHSYHQALSQKLGQIHELQHQSLLNTASDANALPQTTEPITIASDAASEVAWFAQPLQLSQGEPLPTLEPLMTAELVTVAEPVEQLLQMDIADSATSSQSATDPTATDPTNTDPNTTNPTQTVPSDQAWEAWDEYLFTQDGENVEPSLAVDAPRVLTVDVPLPESRSPDLTDPPATQPTTETEPAEAIAAVDAQQELFSNLSDPAQAEEPEQDWTVDETQSVGTVLFGDPVAAAEAVMDEEVANEEDISEKAASTIDPNAPSLEKTIASLGGLLEQVSERMAEMEDEPTRDPEPEEQDSQIVAGETLLATPEATTQTVSTLNDVLDQQKMQQLAADLARFEEGQSEADGEELELDESDLAILDAVELEPEELEPAEMIAIDSESVAEQHQEPEPIEVQPVTLVEPSASEMSIVEPDESEPDVSELDELEPDESEPDELEAIASTPTPERETLTSIESEPTLADISEPESVDAIAAVPASTLPSSAQPIATPLAEGEREVVTLDDIELEAADFETIAPPRPSAVSQPNIIPVAAPLEPNPDTTPVLDNIEVPSQAVYATLSDLSWDDDFDNLIDPEDKRG